MLYDPKWEKQTKTKKNVFELSALIAWLEKRKPDETYCYGDGGLCLLSQYLVSNGFKCVRVWSCGQYEVKGHPNLRYPLIFDDIAHDGRRTFGAALDRARAAHQEIG